MRLCLVPPLVGFLGGQLSRNRGEVVDSSNKELNDAAYAGEPMVMKKLRDLHGVRYKVIDRVNGDPYDLPKIKDHSTVVFDDPDLVIVELDR